MGTSVDTAAAGAGAATDDQSQSMKSLTCPSGSCLCLTSLEHQPETHQFTPILKIGKRKLMDTVFHLRDSPGLNFSQHKTCTACCKQLDLTCWHVQHNWIYPAAMKNTVDYLYHEWKGKPAVIISYGTRGGGRAAEQLKQVLHLVFVCGNSSCAKFAMSMSCPALLFQVLTGLRMQVIPTILTESHIVSGMTDASIAEHFAPHINDVQFLAKLLEEAVSNIRAAPQATK